MALGPIVLCVTGDLYLLQVSQNINPTVKDTFPFSRVKLVDEICGVLLVTLLIPVKTRFTCTVKTCAHLICDL